MPYQQYPEPPVDHEPYKMVISYPSEISIDNAQNQLLLCPKRNGADNLTWLVDERRRDDSSP